MSGSRNSVYINDADQNKTFRFDLLEYPDPAFGLNIAANRESIELSWMDIATSPCPAMTMRRC